MWSLFLPQDQIPVTLSVRQASSSRDQCWFFGLEKGKVASFLEKLVEGFPWHLRSHPCALMPGLGSWCAWDAADHPGPHTCFQPRVASGRPLPSGCPHGL